MNRKFLMAQLNHETGSADDAAEAVAAYDSIHNKLVSIPGHMWGMDLTIVWGTLMAICLLAAIFIFSIIKKLNKVA